MPEFRTIQEVEAELAKYVPIVKQITGKDITLQRMEPLMSKLGNPERKLKIIHVAGTSGKTSTAYYLAAIMQASVGSVGLTVSPHIDSLTERLQLNGKPVTERSFCLAFSQFMKLIKDVDPEPSYFEILIAFAYWFFAHMGVDYLVVETGLGGLHDATNVAQESNKVCVITDIGLDHTKILGHTLPEIATQKAGIIQNGNRVFMYKQTPEVQKVFDDRARTKRAKLKTFEQNQLQKQFLAPGLDKLPKFQQRNWLLARAVVEAITKDEHPESDPQTLLDSLAVQVPGRMDIWQVDGKTLVMDGAHNQQKMTAFVDSFNRQFPHKKATILLALKTGKEHQAVLPLLQPICNRLIITTFDVLQDLPALSIDTDILAKAAKNLGFKEVSIVKDTRKALQKVLSDEDGLVVITGSFYLLSVVRPLIIKT